MLAKYRFELLFLDWTRAIIMLSFSHLYPYASQTILYLARLVFSYCAAAGSNNLKVSADCYRSLISEYLKNVGS